MLRLPLLLLLSMATLLYATTRTPVERLKTEDIHNIGEAGLWGNTEYCPENEFVVGFQFLHQPYQGDRGSQGKVWAGIFSFGIYSIVNKYNKANDDNGLTGIKLLCAKKKDHHDTFHAITSKLHEVYQSRWSEKRICKHGYANGFKLKIQPSQGPESDDVGASNFEIICSDKKILHVDLDFEPGEWPRQFQMCPEQSGICGLQTKVETEHIHDITGLNALNIDCCALNEENTLKDIIDNCTPTLGYELVAKFDNRRGLTPVKYTYKEKVGIATNDAHRTLDRNSKLKSVGNTWGSEASVRVGNDASLVSSSLSAKFEQAFTSATGKDVENEKLLSKSFQKEVEHSNEVDVLPGVQFFLHQMVGHCGPFVIHSKEFNRTDIMDKQKP